ncbi:MAG: hypothetical protein JSV44_05755, partial [Candidatus Zixiibacteriota bacterium]
MNQRHILNVIYTNIGRGHPFYLDGVVKCLLERYGDQIRLNITDVFSVSSGLSLGLWRMVRWLYLQGSQGKISRKFYRIIRRDKKPDPRGIVEKMLAVKVRSYLQHNRYPTLVGHPMLVSMISDLVPVYYQHGEIAVPDLALVSDAEKVFVPLDSCRERLVLNGIPQSTVLATGLCIEDYLAKHAREYYEKRLNRLKKRPVLVGAFFSSGAEPVDHVRAICIAAGSAVSEGHRAVVFCAAGG